MPRATSSVTRIVQALEITLGPDNGRRLLRPTTPNVEAYDFYLRGREFFRRWGVVGAAGDRHLVEFVPWWCTSEDVRP